MKRKRLVLFLVFLPLLQGMACKTQALSPNGDWSRSLESLEQVDDFPLYVMRYYGDYDIPGNSSRAASGVAFTSSPSLWGCTCFSALGGGEYVLGRNFDWYEHPALLLFTDPPGGYASVSMVDISYLGVSKADSPLEFSDRLTNLPLYPFDGMNEHGLSVGMMALSVADPPFDPEKPTVGSLVFIRILLDHARNIDEAISLFADYNIDFTNGPPLHYMVMDASGHSAVIEFVDGEMIVHHNDKPWQVSTNFNLTGLTEEEKRASCGRYRNACQTLEARGGLVSAEEAMTILEDVSQSHTIWSVVYQAGNRRMGVVMGRKYDNRHEFEF